jgi:site-specific DNA-adenine methylase
VPLSYFKIKCSLQLLLVSSALLLFNYHKEYFYETEKKKKKETIILLLKKDWITIAIIKIMMIFLKTFASLGTWCSII